MQVAFIIPVTRPDDFARCLESIALQDFARSDYEVILIRSESCEVNVSEMDIKITQIIENNLHTSLRRNNGVKATDAPLLAFVDDDIAVSKGWISSAVRFIEERGADAVCGPLGIFEITTYSQRKFSGSGNGFILF